MDYIPLKDSQTLEDWENAKNQILINKEYLTSMEDIFEEIEEIAFNPYFCLEYDSADPLFDIYICPDCGKILSVSKEISVEHQNQEVEEFPHTEFCGLNKLKNLIATLGDMIS